MSLPPAQAIVDGGPRTRKIFRPAGWQRDLPRRPCPWRYAAAVPGVFGGTFGAGDRRSPPRRFQNNGPTHGRPQQQHQAPSHKRRSRTRSPIRRARGSAGGGFRAGRGKSPPRRHAVHDADRRGALARPRSARRRSASRSRRQPNRRKRSASSSASRSNSPESSARKYNSGSRSSSGSAKRSSASNKTPSTSGPQSVKLASQHHSPVSGRSVKSTKGATKTHHVESDAESVGSPQPRNDFPRKDRTPTVTPPPAEVQRGSTRRASPQRRPSPPGPPPAPPATLRPAAIVQAPAARERSRSRDRADSRARAPARVSPARPSAPVHSAPRRNSPRAQRDPSPADESATEAPGGDPSPPAPAVAPMPSRPAIAAAAEPPAAAPGGSPALVRLELRFKTKRKVVNHLPSTTMKDLIDKYGAKVAPNLELKITNAEGVEQAPDITVGTAMSAREGEGDVLELRFEEDDW